MHFLRQHIPDFKDTLRVRFWVLCSSPVLIEPSVPTFGPLGPSFATSTESCRAEVYPGRGHEGSALLTFKHLKMFISLTLKTNPQHRQCVVPIRQMRKQTQTVMGDALGHSAILRRAET